MTRFADRRTAGQALAEALGVYANRSDVIVVGVPRGGVPVAAEVAHALRAPLEILVVRKLGAPMQPELALGAIASGGFRVVDEVLVRTLGVSAMELAAVESSERAELVRREGRYRAGRVALSLAGRTVILVDDGLATGATMRVAIQAVRAAKATRVIVAVPVAPPETMERLRAEADEVVCLQTPAHFAGVGAWYERFPQLSDADVLALLGS
jgi:putative phosphoribosyl transferase